MKRAQGAWPRMRIIGALVAGVVVMAGAATATRAAAAPGDRSRGETIDDSLARLLEASEVGDIEGLRAARAVTRDAAMRAVVDVRLAASRLDLAGARAAMRLVVSRRAPPRWRALALASEAGVAFATGDYALSARDSAAWLALPAETDPMHSRADVAQMEQLAERLAGLPDQRVDRTQPGSTPTWRDRATLVRARVEINGIEQEAVIDTGANLSVVSESTARRLGLAVVEGASVRSSSREAVPVRIAVAARLNVAGTSLANVKFLVMTDSALQLPLPGGYEIPAIIGFPELRALGRVTFDRDIMSVGERARADARSAALVASGSDLFVTVRIDGIGVPLHIDSGASSTSLGARFAAANPSLIAGLETRTSRSAGAGGATEETAHVLKDAMIEIGAAHIRLPAIDVSAPDAERRGNFGTLGQDVLRSSGRYTLDFRRMTLTLEDGDPPPR